ncbi:hypothetical protein [Corynebacterium halotolerans]|uniref:hypothetical protein n=1 Tax=Corynebacterium halotolerans TaxID=225326 RepID=UPI003CED471F
MTQSSYPGYAAADGEKYRFFDVAHEGAQARSVAGVVESGRLDRLHGMRPRSVVVVATDQVSRAAARAVNTLRCPLRQPVVVTDSLPSYFGALDILVVVGERNSAAAHHALTTASSRGAVTVLAGTEGPVAEDAPGDTVVLPVLPTTLGFSPARTIIALSVVLDLLEEEPGLVVQRLHSIAEAIDAELASLSPERDIAVNPGRGLRGHVEGARIVHTGNRAVAEVVATVWTLKGLPSAVADVEELPGVLADQDPEQDLFHDPFLDGPGGMLPLKAVVWAADLQGVPGASVQNCSEEPPGPIAEALVLITRGFAATTYSTDPEEY